MLAAIAATAAAAADKLAAGEVDDAEAGELAPVDRADNGEPVLAVDVSVVSDG